MSDEKYRAILEKDPTDTQAFVALCNSAERSNDYQYLAQLYDFRAQVIQDTQEIADLYFKAGEIFIDKMNKLSEAVEAFLKGFEADRTHAGIGDRLDAIYREAGDWESAVQISEQRLDAMTVADSNGTKTVIRSDLHQQTGEIWEKVYSDRKKALSHYKKAIELDKTNILALYSAREIYYAAGKFKNAAKLCELEARAEKDTSRREALYRELAHLYETKLEDIPHALVAYKRALKANPKSREVQQELARLIALTPLTEENTKDHGWATEFLIRMAADVSGKEAYDLLEQAIISTPSSEKALMYIESKAAECGDYNGLAGTYESIVNRLENETHKRPIIKQLVSLYRNQLNDSAAAERWALLLPEGAVGLDTGDDEPTPVQPTDLSKLGNMESHSSMPPFPTGSIPPPSAPGSIAPPFPSGSIPPPSAAVPVPTPAPPSPIPSSSSTSQSASVPIPPPRSSMPAPPKPSSAPVPVPGPSSPPAGPAASFEYDDEASQTSQIAPVSVSVPVKEPGMSDEVFAEELRLTAERARRGGDDYTAELCLLQVLDMYPHDQKAITYLERRFRARSDWQSLRDLLLRSAGAPHLPQAVQTVRLREAARLSEEQLDDVFGAIDAWKIIKSNDPKVRDATDALIRLLGQGGQWEELLGILGQEAETTKSRTKKLDAYARMAEIYHRHLGDMDAAAAAYENLLEINPEEMKALEALEDIYIRSERYEEVVLLLKKRAKLASDKSEKRDMLFRAASVLREELGRSEDAYAIAREILTFSKDDVEVLVLLSLLDEEAGHWERLVSTLEIRIHIAEDGGEKIDLLRKKAEISLTRLQNRGAAVDALNDLLQLAEDDLPALDTLAQIQREEENWEGLVETLKKRLGAIADREEQISIHRELARTLEQKLLLEEEAMVSWRAVLDMEADSESLGALARYFERSEKWDDFTDVIQRQAAYAEDHRERADILFRRAAIIHEKLNDTERAKEELERILKEVNPSHDDTITLLIDILVSKGSIGEAAELLDQRISYTQDREKAKTMLIQLGEWSRKELSDLQRAVDAYERAVQLDKDDETLLDALDEVYTEQEAWDKLLKLLYARAKTSDDDRQKFDILSRGALICEEQLQDKAKAWTWNIELLDRLAHLEETVPKVEEAARRMSLWRELIDLAAAMTRKAESEDEQVVWWLKAADVFEENMADPGQALEAVLRAFGLTPENEALLDKVDRLAVKVQNWQRLGTVYGVLAQRTEEKDRKISLLERYAAVLMDQGNRPSDAFDVIVRAFELAPESETLLEKVAEIGTAAGRWSDLIRIYNGCANLAEDLERKVALKLKAVEVYRDKKVDPDSALITLLEALRFDPFADEVTTEVWDGVERLEADLVPTEAGAFWNKLVEAYRILVEEHKGEKSEQAALILKISEVYVEKLQDVAAAFEAMKEIQQLDPKDESAIDALEELASKNDYWEMLVEHYQDVLDETFEMDVAVMLHKRRARILEEELNREDEAAEHYWQIIQLDATETVAYEKLVGFYERSQRWNELVNLLERQLDSTSEDEEKKPIILRIANIWESNIGNKYEAKDWFEQALTLWPDDETALAGLARMKENDKVDEEEDDDDDDFNDIISSIPDSIEEDEEEEEDDAESNVAPAAADEAASEEGADDDNADDDASIEDDDASIEDDDTPEDAADDIEDDFPDDATDGDSTIEYERPEDEADNVEDDDVDDDDVDDDDVDDATETPESFGSEADEDNFESRIVSDDDEEIDSESNFEIDIDRETGGVSENIDLSAFEEEDDEFATNEFSTPPPLPEEETVDDGSDDLDGDVTRDGDSSLFSFDDDEDTVESPVSLISEPPPPPPPPAAVRINRPPVGIPNREDDRLTDADDLIVDEEEIK